MQQWASDHAHKADGCFKSINDVTEGQQRICDRDLEENQGNNLKNHYKSGKTFE